MKLIIFGATGGTGRHLINQSLEQGHSVTAFARNPKSLQIQHEKLHLIKGDVLNLGSVQSAIDGHDAVFCTLGTPAMNKSMLRTNGTKNIIQAMQQSTTKRLICQSGMGCGDSKVLLPFHYKYIIFPLMLRYVYADHESQEQHVSESQLNWTIIRPAALSNGKHTSRYWHGFAANDATLSIKISRADVADFMLKQLSDNTYLHKSPSVSYANKITSY